MDIKTYLSEKHKVVEDALEEGKAPTKKYYIKGPMLEGDIKNQNGRIYPVPVLEKETKRYLETKVDGKRALGELGHPSTTEINLDRVLGGGRFRALHRPGMVCACLTVDL